MKNFIKLLSLSLLVFLPSCFIVPSLHPLYSDKDLIFEPALLGVWTSDDSKDTLSFTMESEKSYLFALTDEKGEKTEFVAHLLKIPNTMFLDLYPADASCHQNDFYSEYFIPVHSFMLVSQIEPALQLSSFEMDWLKKFIEKNPKAIRHEKIKDNILLTASTLELQKFLLAHVKTEGAFGSASNLTRQTGGQ
jgi:hypothetical protein